MKATEVRSINAVSNEGCIQLTITRGAGPCEIINLWPPQAKLLAAQLVPLVLCGSVTPEAKDYPIMRRAAG